MTDQEAKILEAVRGISVAALNRWKSRPDSTIGRFARAVLEYRKTCFDKDDAGQDQIELLKKQLACANAQADLFAERARETNLSLHHANTYIAELENKIVTLSRVESRVRAVKRESIEGFYPGELVFWVNIERALKDD